MAKTDPATWREAARQCREEARLDTDSSYALERMARRFDKESTAAAGQTDKALCPFCRSEPRPALRQVDSAASFAVVCGVCLSSGPLSPNPTMAVAAWNKAKPEVKP
jgi:hypothetical protein